MQTIGDCAIFAFRLEPASDDPTERLMRSVSIFVDGVNFTEHDSIVYVPQFIHSLKQTVNKLNNIDLNRYKKIWRGEDPENIHTKLTVGNLIEDSQWADMLADLQFLEFGETTYNLLSFFIPRDNNCWITCQSVEDPEIQGSIHSVCIDFDDLIKCISDTADIIEVDFAKVEKNM